MVFPRVKVAVFIDGCFWHGCAEHGTAAKANANFWEAKIARNRARDADTSRQLADAGWTVIRVWEHDDPADAAIRVARLVRQALAMTRSGGGPRETLAGQPQASARAWTTVPGTVPANVAPCIVQSPEQAAVE